MLYSVRARTGEHETSQQKKPKNPSGHLSFFIFLSKRKKVLDITISVAVQRKCSLESGLQKVTFFFFARSYCCCVCLSFCIVSVLKKNNIIKLASWKLNCIFLSEMWMFFCLFFFKCQGCQKKQLLTVSPRLKACSVADFVLSRKKEQK